MCRGTQSKAPSCLASSLSHTHAHVLTLSTPLFPSTTYCHRELVMPVQKELSDLEHGPASGAGSEIDLHPPVTPMEGKRGEDHVLDFNVSNFSTPAGKQILHDVGT